jgi:hypothetical protein
MIGEASGRGVHGLLPTTLPAAQYRLFDPFQPSRPQRTTAALGTKADFSWLGTSVELPDNSTSSTRHHSVSGRLAEGIRANNLLVRAHTVTGAHLDHEADQVDCARARHRGEIPNCAKSPVELNSPGRTSEVVLKGPIEWPKSTTGRLRTRRKTGGRLVLHPAEQDQFLSPNYVQGTNRRLFDQTSAWMTAFRSDGYRSTCVGSTINYFSYLKRGTRPSVFDTEATARRRRK